MQQKLQAIPRQYKAKINLRVMGGTAKPSPKMGQALGPLGINMMQFCKDFNEKTQNIRPDVPMKVVLYAYADRTFKFMIKPPETSWFIRKGVGRETFSNFTRHMNYDKISLQQIYHIAQLKQEIDPHLQHVSLQAICRSIIGQCGSMGILLTTEYQKPASVIRPVIKI